jgi:hypothetical protein
MTFGSQNVSLAISSNKLEALSSENMFLTNNSHCRDFPTNASSAAAPDTADKAAAEDAPTAFLKC